MNNFRYGKRLLTIFLAGAITLTTAACTMRKNNPVSPVSMSIAEDYNENMVEGKITLTENVIDLPTEVSLDTQEATVVSEPISEVMRYYNEFKLTDAHAKAATLHSSNVRTGPSTDYDIVDTLCRGTILEVLGRTDDYWYLVSNNGQLYFTIGSNITMLNYIYDGMTINDIVPNLTLAIQPTTKLNVRSEPKKDSTKLGLISGNRTYKVIEHLSNGWYKIDYQGKEAYVSGDYCRETYMLDGNFYQYVYPKHDCYLYDEQGNVKRTLEQYEGGTVYNENDEYYLIWVGDDYGFVRRSDVKIAPGRVINVDLSLQEVQVIDGSELLMQTDTCTGAPGRETDKGVWTLGSETGPTVLRGPGYECPVANFASVNGGEGFHPYDCDNFGDVNGAASHGCYRLRLDQYEEFFRLTKAGDTVITHK